MSYQVLARKWRPKTFTTLVGQEHVVRALTHALEQKRLHHAWLFTGTRGVGKTTIARILAKSLNCLGSDGHGDITAQPCGVCRACNEIDAGRFVDYIEMDAASNRGVDEMAQLLEQAVYAPTNGRFKIYMIDEVHMLTNHAFNSMLKTLEEPPEYVKFILATTDPQKIPVTVLSRCLQFNLKQMPAGQIVGYLDSVLSQEGIGFEPRALALIARAANGSMRDALSLTDQAIAYCAGQLSESAIATMLGALDQTYLVRILAALERRDGAGMLAVADEIAQRSLSYRAALQDLAGLLQRIAVAQVVASALSDDGWDSAMLQNLAGQFTAEEVQLYYQIVTHGRNELELAPDEYAGFTMTLLRLLAFSPQTLQQIPVANIAAATAPSVTKVTAISEPAAGFVNYPLAPTALTTAPSLSVHQALAFDGDWIKLVPQLSLSGLARQLVQQAELVNFDEHCFKLRVPIKALLEGGTLDKVKVALAKYFGRPMQVSVQVGAVQGTTVAAVSQEQQVVRQAQALGAIDADPFVQALINDLGASVIPGSIRPIDQIKEEI